MDEQEALKKAKADEATMLSELRKRRELIAKVRGEMDTIEHGLVVCRQRIVELGGKA